MATALVRSIGFGFLLAALATSSVAADKTLSVTEKADFPVSPAKAWETIKDYNGWQNWHPAIASTEISKGKENAKGTVRVLTTKDGAKITEELLAHSDKSMSYKYRIIDSPLPVTNYVSTVNVMKVKGGSEVVWSSNFKAKAGTSAEEAKKVISGIYTAGLDNLKSILK
jgi:Polyketide cyclase / dehydrase and lipid transport